MASKGRQNDPLTYKTCLMALRNMPNRGPKHAKPRRDTCLTEMRYMPNRNTKDALSQCQTCLIVKRIYLFGYL